MSALAPAVGAGEAASEDVADRFAGLAARIDRLIVAIDAALAAQVDAILHAPAFRALEGRWRALHALVDQAAGGEAGAVRIRMLSATWRELARDLDRAVEFDQSHLHALVYDGEFGMPGGLPFGLILGDYAVSDAVDTARGDQVETLARLAAVGASAFCPVILGAGPDLLGMRDWSEIRPETDLADDPPPRHVTRWQGLRRREDARFLGLVAPPIAIRAPYRRYQPDRTDGFAYDEDPRAALAVSGAWAFASTLISAFHDTGWFAAIRGAYQDEAGGGRVPAFGAYDFGTDGHGLSAQAPVILRLTAAQEEALILRGIVPLAALPLSAAAVFNANPSLHLPASYDQPVATENARLAAMLQYVLCTSRFAHYLKVMMRDEIGSTAPPAEIERRLGDWLRDHCLGNDDAEADLKAQYPLRDAGVHVTPRPGHPGSYTATIRLQPHFQLDDVATSFHLIAEAPSRRDEGVSA